MPALPPWKFPYTNTRDINLDWIIKTVKNLYNQVRELLDGVEGYMGLYLTSDTRNAFPLTFTDDRITGNMIMSDVGFLEGGTDWEAIDLTLIPAEDINKVGMGLFTINEGSVVVNPALESVPLTAGGTGPVPLLANSQLYVCLIVEKPHTNNP